jgi:hypothetical protein
MPGYGAVIGGNVYVLSVKSVPASLVAVAFSAVVLATFASALHPHLPGKERTSISHIKKRRLTARADFVAPSTKGLAI